MSIQRFTLSLDALSLVMGGHRGGCKSRGPEPEPVETPEIPEPPPIHDDVVFEDGDATANAQEHVGAHLERALDLDLDAAFADVREPSAASGLLERGIDVVADFDLPATFEDGSTGRG
ncbi:MAG: hypothetical protein KF819_01865 [Labilithrix sp.]|nr:hypothetical protein [Labilithrix sp.]